MDNNEMQVARDTSSRGVSLAVIGWGIAAIAFSILICTFNNSPMVLGASFWMKFVAVVAGSIAGWICSLLGDAIRKFARPDAFFTTGGIGSIIGTKLFWLCGPQLIGLAVGSILGCALVLHGDEHTRIRGEYIAGCTRVTSKSICICVFEKLDDHYGQQLKSSSVPSDFTNMQKRFSLECDSRNLTATTGSASAQKSAEARVAEALSKPSSNSQELAAQSSSIGETKNSSSKELLNAAIAKMIENETSAIGGTEFFEGRKVVEADFNGDGAMDAVVLYTIEGADGSNASRQTLVLFHRNTYAYAPQDSINVSGVLDIALNADHSISATIAIHAPNDADCCPSLGEQHIYHTDKGRLARIKD